MRFDWESFPQYMDALERLPHSLDFLLQVPHDPLRMRVMGERAQAQQAATPQDIEAMCALLREALQAGAAGFSTGRSDNHRTSRGEETPASEASAAELVEQLAVAAGRPLSMTWMQRDPGGEQYLAMQARVEAAVGRGLSLYLQTAARGIGVINGLDASFHSFIGSPAYKEAARLPLAERAAALREPGAQGARVE